MIKKREVLIGLLFAVLMVTTFIPAATVPETVLQVSDKELVYDWTAGYADELYFRVIMGAEQQVLALQAGEIDLVGQFIDPQLVEPLIIDPDVLINMTNRKGFGQVTLNCAAAPTNWTEFRQAFAFALDKDGIQQQALGGYSRAVDSPIPASMGHWSLDNHPDFTTNYYEPDAVAGNALLDAAGFAIPTGEVYREDPNGNAIDIGVMGANTGSVIIETVVDMSVEALESLHIKAYANLLDFNTMLGRLDADDFNMMFFAFSGFGVDPIFLDNFQTDEGVGGDNYWNWSNATYDTLVDDMFASNVLEDVQEYCWDAQKILWQEQPIVVAYQNLLISAYRKDPWEGYVNTEGQGVFDTTTFNKVRLKPGMGGDAFGQGAVSRYHCPSRWNRPTC